MKMEQVCTVKKKKKVEGVVCSKGVTLIFFLNNNKKSFVYIKIDITRVGIVPRAVLQNLFCF